MKRKLLLKSIMVGICLLLLQPSSVMAAELTVNSSQDVLAIETEWEEADGYEIIEDYNTARSQETPCFLTVQTLCPNGFGLNTYALLMGENGCMFRISMSAENNYIGRIYLAPGEYEVTEVAVFDDYKQEYPFAVDERMIVLTDNENKTLSYAMREYQQIAEIIEQKKDSETGTANVVLTDDLIYETGLLGVTMKGSGVLYYEVEHKGIGTGVMECTGNAKGTYDVVVKIVKSGVVGEALFQISLDGGLSYIGQDIVADSSKIGDAGLTIYFKTEEDTTEFIEGDEYHISTVENFTVIASKICSANVIVQGHPLEDHDLVVNILSSGGYGKSKFTVESTKGKEIRVTDVMPIDGIYELEDGLSLVFSDSQDYEKGLSYNVSVRSNDTTVDYTPLYILFGVLVAVGATFLTVMNMKKDNNSDYILRQYDWRKNE